MANTFAGHIAPGFSQQGFWDDYMRGGMWRGAKGSCQGQGQRDLCFLQQEVELRLQGGLCLLAWGSAWNPHRGWITDWVLIWGAEETKPLGVWHRSPRALMSDRLSNTKPELNQQKRQEWRIGKCREWEQEVMIYAESRGTESPGQGHYTKDPIETRR